MGTELKVQENKHSWLSYMYIISITWIVHLLPPKWIECTNYFACSGKSSPLSSNTTSPLRQARIHNKMEAHNKTLPTTIPAIAPPDKPLSGSSPGKKCGALSNRLSINIWASSSETGTYPVTSTVSGCSRPNFTNGTVSTKTSQDEQLSNNWNMSELYKK